jgi:ADP-heptose:LPS heptosyltransferase
MVKVMSKLGSIINTAMLSITDFFAISRPANVRENTLLLVRLDAIGDYVLFRSSIEALRKSEKYKHYKITLCGNSVWKELAETLDKNFVDEFVWINAKKFVLNVFYRYGILRSISRKGFEVAIQPTYSRVFLEGDTVIKASNAKERIGSQGDWRSIKPWWKNLSDGWYTHLVPASAGQMMELCRNAEFMRGLGLSSFRAGVPVIDIPDDEIKPIEEGRYYVLVSGALLEYKRWPIESFATLAEKIYDSTGWVGVICGGKSEEELGQKLQSLCSAPLRNMAGKTSLLDLVNIINKARLVVSNDTGAAHIAAAVATPVVCILGGGHYGRFMPYQVEEEPSRPFPVVVTHKMDCFNCNWNCIYKTERNTPYPCIKNISVEDVWSQAYTLIEQANKRSR